MRRRIWSILLYILASSSAVAHDDDVTLRLIDAKVARGDGPATVLLLRAEIERANGRLAEAAAVLDSVALLIPHSGTLALCRAGLAEDRGRPDEVLRVLDACPDTALASDPRVPWMRAEALARLGRMTAAAKVMDAALARGEAATADHFLARSRVAERCPGEGPEVAILVLEAGLERWPGAWNLASRLVDLEVAAGRYDAALAHLDAVIAAAPRPERLLAQRGDLLERAGRPWEAREAWTQALTGLEARAAADAASRELQTRLKTALSQSPPTQQGTPP
jgi:tetratricopeptide (TPR) repeat protein